MANCCPGEGELELERVPKKELKPGDLCPICGLAFLDGMSSSCPFLSPSSTPSPPRGVSHSSTLSLCLLPFHSKPPLFPFKPLIAYPPISPFNLPQNLLTNAADPYPLVIRLPCHESHLYDLECISPWLKLQSTCPLDRVDLLARREERRKAVTELGKEDGGGGGEGEEEEGEWDEMFA